MTSGTSTGKSSGSTGTLTSGMKKENLRFREHDKDELAHYAKGCVDVEYKFPFGRATGRSLRASPTAPTTTCGSISAGCGPMNDWFENGKRPDEDQAAPRGRRIISQGPLSLFR